MGKDRYPWTQIIWPAKPGDHEGSYGIAGSLRSTEMLELARSMGVADRAEATGRAGCL